MNDNKPHWVIYKIKVAVAGFNKSNPEKTGKNITIAYFETSFKANIDHLRVNQALAMTRQVVTDHTDLVLAMESNIEKLPGKLNLANIEIA